MKVKDVVKILNDAIEFGMGDLELSATINPYEKESFISSGSEIVSLLIMDLPSFDPQRESPIISIFDLDDADQEAIEEIRKNCGGNVP